MGATQFALPQVSIALYSASSGGQLGDPSCSVSIFLLALLIPLMAAAWLISIVVGALVLRRMGKERAQIDTQPLKPLKYTSAAL